MLAGLGRDISPAQEDLLHRYLVWLSEEAIPAGALGPAEADRLHDRHIADSLLFLHGWEQDLDPERMWDLGSGAGLPGIPLAVALPNTEVTLVDRSGRRVELMRRALRILDLPNVRVLQSDVEDVEGVTPLLVSRATISPQGLTGVVRRLVRPGGVAVVGGSWIAPPEPPTGWERKEIPRDPLDRSVWLLIMRR